MHFRLFNKPAAFAIEDAGKHKMWIDGIYEDYHPGEPYEGFVQIHGNVGLMKLRIVDSNLPPGASVYIDQVLRRVIVKWAKYSPPVQEVTEVPNGSFRDGPAYWETTGDGTPVRFDDWSPNNAKSATYHDQKGEYIFVGAWAPVSSVNRQIEIKAKVEHGKSSKGNASAAIGLAWYDENRNLVRYDWGNAVNNGGKGRWYDTSVKQPSSDRTVKFVRPAVKFTRKKQNHPIHIGQITWDHAYVQGYDEDEQLFIEVEVTDSVNNTARHRGVIDEVNLWFTSQMYPWSVHEAVSTFANETEGGSMRGNPIPHEKYSTFAHALTGGELRSNVVNYRIPSENYRSYEHALIGGALRPLVTEYKRYNEDTYRTHTHAITGGTMRILVIGNKYSEDTYRTHTHTIIGGTLA